MLATQLEKLQSQKRELLTALRALHHAGVGAADHVSVAQLLAKVYFPSPALAQPNISLSTRKAKTRLLRTQCRPLQIRINMAAP